MSAQNVNLNDLLQQVPIADIAKQFGIDEATATQAVQQALPGLLGGGSNTSSGGLGDLLGGLLGGGSDNGSGGGLGDLLGGLLRGK